mgnify:CR=1 FL=1
MGRPERPIGPDAGPAGELAVGLRALRDAAGRPSYRELARRASFSVTVLSEAAGGRVLPTLPVLRGFVQACGGNVAEWEQRWTRAAALVRGLRDARERANAAQRPAGPAAGGTGPAGPRELPAGVRHFVGRADELAALTALLDRNRAEAPATVMVAVISGTAGVGKTSLAVRWAHQVTERFPDGQLYVDLCGYDPGRPRPAAEALAGFLRALGVSGPDIPAGTAERAARYRSLLAGRRLLIVLDNAGSVDQVRPLLPGTSACAVVVTSRDTLVGLVARDGAQRLDLDLLPRPTAVRLLRALVGARVDADPAAAEALAEQCSRLPLAVRVAAELAAARPAVTLAELVSELADQRQRLDLLAADGDARTGARSVFSWSYKHLSEPAQRMFRRLGSHPGPAISTTAAASLAALPPSQAGELLAELTRAHLLTEPAAGRFACHDLLRAYAADRAAACDDEATRLAATRRMLDHYLHTAHAAALLLTRSRDPLTLTRCPAGVTPEHLGDRDAALDWFAAEHQALAAAIGLAAEAGLAGHAWQLAWALGAFLEWRGFWPEWTAVLGTALVTAERQGDQAGQARTHLEYGLARARQGRYDEAYSHLGTALGLFGALGDRSGQARTHHYLGVVLSAQDRDREALGESERALELFQAVGNRAAQAMALNNVGWLRAHLGDYDQALAHCQRALELHRAAGYRAGQAHTWDSLGYIRHHQGQHVQAIGCYQRALGLYREISDRYYQVSTLIHLGDTHRAVGQAGAARAAWQQALATLGGLHHPEADQVRAKLDDLRLAPAPAAESGGRARRGSPTPSQSLA